jgi:PAS domain S-box-containing protein
MTQDTLDARVDARVLADTLWAELPHAVLRQVLHGASVRAVPARGTIFGIGEPGPRAGILLFGTARGFLAAADGRQLTVRYSRRGAFIGRRSYLLGGHAPVATHAVTDVEILDLEAPRFLQLAKTEVAVSVALLAELSRRLEDVHATVADGAFGSIRERVARHLLALTDDREPDGRRVARITQQELADGVGTMREVVARALGGFRKEGLIATSAGQIEILDATSLAASLGAWQVAASGLGPDLRQDVEAILEASPTAIIAVNPDGVIRYVNGLAEAMFGVGRSDVVGRQVEILLPEHLRERHVSYRGDFLADPVPRPLYQRTGLMAKRRDGTEFPVNVGLSPVDTRSGMMILATVAERAEAPVP